MKFLQFSMDYYINENVVDVQWLNEASLQQGRSLKRPQNKTTITEYDFSEYSSSPFDVFLSHCGLSPLLQSIAMYSIALYVKNPSEIVSDEVTAAFSSIGRSNDGMSRIGGYLHSLGRYGSSAFLLPM
jgi:hypothetical protein